ncbi:potassium channel family protein [Rubrivirga marina]|uniref:Potassium channel domain-containing protein n=1 Tax=Rubrivirga marina TaxID=1196024 RepID=A0A271IZ47_9BACT|nr:potassium channel family protein [Rubrivirga marina]PAP76347.1 hypothetical protein BSZ37_07765 [Rubrivirga marina]
MSVALAVLGAALVLVALYDVVKTTLSAQGGAPVTSALSAGLWALLGRGPAHGLPRRAAGGTILAAVPVAWTLLLWAGWTLVFASDAGAVVDASSQAPADLPARVYFVGFTLFTLGNGDFVPAGPTWRVLTAVASFSGLFLVTLAITYLLPVVQAVAQKRSLAGRIHSLGPTGAAIAAKAPSPSLERQLESVAADLTLHAERHLVYPVLHYFESDEARTALAPHLAALSDAALLLRHGLPEADRPDGTALGSVEAALDDYLGTVRGSLVSPSEDAPPPPPASDLSRPAADADVALAEAAGQRGRQRRLLRAIVHQSGHDWPTGRA